MVLLFASAVDMIIPVKGLREGGFFKEEIMIVMDPDFARAAVLDRLKVNMSKDVPVVTVAEPENAVVDPYA